MSPIHRETTEKGCRDQRIARQLAEVSTGSSGAGTAVADSV
jgi:hypothetical protein